PSTSITPDRFEINETQNSAKFIGSMPVNSGVTSLSLHTSSDQDWYRFQVQSSGVQTIRVKGDGTSGVVSFTFYDVTKGRERTINSTMVNGVATLNVDLRTGVNYFLHVRSPIGALTWYRLLFGNGGTAASAGQAVVASADGSGEEKNVWQEAKDERRRAADAFFRDDSATATAAAAFEPRRLETDAETSGRDDRRYGSGAALADAFFADDAFGERDYFDSLAA
ncbi:MAG TPA: hypothetical protein VNC50_11235, partial [Planctomycetia bacterium]|nr:hypothetical protein [Planctomycetia bacterium]